MFARAVWIVKQGSLFVRQPFRGRARDLRRLQDVSPVLAGVPRVSRVRHAVRSVLGRPAKGPAAVWAVTMVRNEADIIEHTLAHLLAQGVDRIVVADNLSTDATPAILARCAAQDPRIIVVADRQPAYYQGDKMSRLARAATMAGAAWIIPFDADEAWFTESGEPLAAFLRSTRDDVVKGYLENHVPLPSNDSPNPYVRFPYRVAELGPHKVAFRANFVSRIWTGNHQVSHPGPVGRGVRIAHVPYRSMEQMRAKVQVGTTALTEASGQNRDFGSHWRELASLDDAGLREAFDRFVASADLIEDPVPYC